MPMVHIDNAYENVKQHCEIALMELFPVGIPEFAQARFDDEINYLGEIGDVSDFELHRLLCIEAKKSLQCILSRYYDTNFFLLYLMNQSLGNPLPAHYYCPDCGYYELPGIHKFGIDLPEKNCPKCGKKLRRDGFDLLVEFSMSITRNRVPAFQCISNTEFLPFAYRILKKTYPNREIVPKGTHEFDVESEKQKVKKSGFYILPEGKCIDDFAEYKIFFEDGTACLSEKGEDDVELHLGHVEIVPDDRLDYLITLQRKTGIYLDEVTVNELARFTWNDLRNAFILDEAEANLLDGEKPKSVYEMTAIHSFVNNWYENYDMSKNQCIENMNFFKSQLFQKLPCFTREDIFETVKTYGIDNKDAYMIAEKMRRGLLGNPDSRNERIMKYIEILNNLPKELQEMAKITKGLTSRGDMVMEVLLNLLLVYYMKEDKKTYSDVVYKNK